MGSCKHWTQYTERRQTKIHNTNIENRRDNQEWAAVNIGHNTQHEDKQKYTTQAKKTDGTTRNGQL